MPLPRRFETALLLDGPSTADLTGLADVLNEVLGPTGLSFNIDAEAPHLLTAGSLHIVVEAMTTPLDAEKLARTLDSGFHDILHEDWAGWAQSHKAALLLTIGEGASPDAPPNALSDGPMRELFDQMLTVGHVATTRLCGELEPIAIWWGQSNQLFAPDRFLAMADMLFPLPVYLHPRPFSSGRTDGEMQVIGYELDGAETIIGLGLKMNEAPARLDWLVERGFAFVAHLRALGDLPEHGETFGVEPGERFRIAHGTDGKVTLTLKERDEVLVLQPEEAGDDLDAPGIRLQADSATPHFISTIEAEPKNRGGFGAVRLVAMIALVALLGWGGYTVMQSSSMDITSSDGLLSGVSGLLGG